MVMLALCVLAASATTILASPPVASDNGLRIVSVLNGQDQIDAYIKTHSDVPVVNLAKDQPGHLRILGVFQGKDEIVKFASENNVKIRVPEGTPLQDPFAPAAAPSSPRSARPPPSNPRSAQGARYKPQASQPVGTHPEPPQASQPVGTQLEPPQASQAVASNDNPSQGEPASTNPQGEQAPVKKIGPIAQQMIDWNNGLRKSQPNLRLLYEEQKKEYEAGERDEPPDEELMRVLGIKITEETEETGETGGPKKPGKPRKPRNRIVTIH